MNSFKNNMRKLIVTTVVMMAALVSLTTLTGCDEYGYGGYGYDSYGGGYGPIDSGVFDNAASDWSDYFRGDYAGGGGNNDPELTGDYGG